MCLDSADVIIEFSKPEATVQYLQQAVDADKAVVIGTTGFSTNELTIVKTLASQTRCVMGPQYEPRCQCDDPSLGI